jgi:hypothetical protein
LTAYIEKRGHQTSTPAAGILARASAQAALTELEVYTGERETDCNIMPPPSSQRADIQPPDQVTTEAIKGFATGALRVCSCLSHGERDVIVVARVMHQEPCRLTANSSGRCLSSHI